MELLKQIKRKWLKFVNALNELGIPIPMARDPKTKLGSVSLSMVCVSFGLMAACVVLAILLVVNKLANFFTTPDSSLASLKEAFWMAFQMSSLSAGLYWGRKFQKDDKKISLEDEEKKVD